MPMTVRAVYTGGVLRPVQPLGLKEGEAVEIIVAPATTPTPLSEQEIVRRIEACKTYEQWLQVTKLLPADDGGYDIVKALDENRRWSGDRPSILPEKLRG
jgi:predicted DNA-binding antitoxin AbrB/MazE fold protein